MHGNVRPAPEIHLPPAPTPASIPRQSEPPPRRPAARRTWPPFPAYAAAVLPEHAPHAPAAPSLASGQPHRQLPAATDPRYATSSPPDSRQPGNGIDQPVEKRFGL